MDDVRHAFFQAFEGWKCEVDVSTWQSLTRVQSDLSQRIYEHTEVYSKGMGEGADYAPVNLFLECVKLLRDDGSAFDRRVDAKRFLEVVSSGLRNEQAKDKMRGSLNKILTCPAEQLSKRDLSDAVRSARACIRLWENSPDIVKVQRQIFQDAFEFLQSKERTDEEERMFRQVCTHQYTTRVPLGIAHLTLEAVSQYKALKPVDERLASKFLPAQVLDKQDLYELVLQRVGVMKKSQPVREETPAAEEAPVFVSEESFADSVYGLIVKQSRESEYPEELVASALDLALNLDEFAADGQREALKEQLAHFDSSRPLNRVLLQSMPGWQQFQVFAHNLVEEVREGKTPDVAGLYQQACGAYSA